MGDPPRMRPGELTAAEIADALWLRSGPARESVPPADVPVPPASGTGESDDGPAPPDLDPRPAADLSPADGVPPTGRSGEPVEAHASPRPAPALHGPAAGGVRVPTLPTLPNTLLLQRALRPLRSRGSTRHQLLLDEEATARRAVEDELWLPLLRTTPTRPWAEAVVITDTSPSMGIWRQTAQEFTRLLPQLDVCDTVRTVQLVTEPRQQDGAGTGGVPVPGLRTRTGVLSAASLTAPAGRRLLLVVTDGLAAAWRSGAVGALLHRLARTQTVAVVHLLPESSWRTGGIATDLVALTDRAGRPGNASLRWSMPARWHGDGPRPGRDEGPAPEGIPVPVLELSPLGLGGWARLVGGRGGAHPVPLHVMWAAPRPPQGSDPDESDAAGTAPPTAEQRVQLARSTLSPSAFRLAVGLAAVPLDLPTVLFLQQNQFPETRLHHLSEVVASGLLRHVPVPRPGTAADLPFDFRPGVREQLLPLTTRAETVRAIDMVLRAAPSGSLTSGQRFLRAVLDGGDPAPPEAAPGERGSLQLAATVLRALSGPYLDSAERAFAALSADSAPATVSAESASIRSATEGVVAAADSAAVAAGPPGSRPASDPRPSPEPRPPSIWGPVPLRNVHFTGREEQLGVLRERLGHGESMVSAEVVTGMGAVGKSQLAIEYVYRHAAEFDLVWWIRAETPTSVIAALHDLAKALRLPPPPDAGPHAVVPQVLEALRAGDVSRRWLLVFDSAESVDRIRPFLPKGGPGSVLITTRNPQWAQVAPTVDLDVLPRQESIALLRRRGPHLGAAEADRLADALGDLPLALEQASAWLRETGMPVPEYLRLFEARRTELLDMSPPHDYETSVSAAWRVAVARIAEEDPSAARMLWVLASLAPAPVPLDLFARRDPDHAAVLDGLPADPIGVGRALRTLNRFSMLRIDHYSRSVQMHRLVSAFVRADMDLEQSARALDASRRLLAGLAPGAGLTRHFLACRAAESSAPSVRAAVLGQLRWLAAHAEAEDARHPADAEEADEAYALALAAYEAWRRRTDEAAVEELAALSPYLPPPEP
ncbi:FxSxx-COOH system tetratricopeptide repeat protein [Streptomyces sp. NPDC015171]|uniref:FxSxx-COOH system tetratricopeptide repeat protein n=1 Tax=Streptomyces sp. NPDC015171 TaxID=3364945 RepID=UPI00370332D4